MNMNSADNKNWNFMSC